MRGNVLACRIRYWLIFKTHAGCGRRSSGRSGSSTDNPAFDALNFNGALEPRRLTPLAAFTSLITRLWPVQRGRMAQRALPFTVKKASIEALPSARLSVNLATSYADEYSLFYLNF